MEVGFGPGVGLQEACKFVKGGSIHGIDISDKMIEDATKRLSAELMANDLHLSKQRFVVRFSNSILGSVLSLVLSYYNFNRGDTILLCQRGEYLFPR